MKVLIHPGHGNQALVESGQLDVVFVSRRFATHPRGIVSCDRQVKKPSLYKMEDNQSYDSNENKTTTKTQRALMADTPETMPPLSMHNDSPSPIQLWPTDVHKP